MNELERYAWIELALTPYIGSETFLRILKHFGSAQIALAADVAEIKPFLIRSRAGQYWRSEEARKAAEAALQWEQKHENARLLLLAENDYPPLLSEGLTPPPLLFIRGNIHYLQQPSLAIVGSRHATPQAMRIARDFAKALAQKEIAVISGMADGIDTAAHQGALLGKGTTVAVWGTGIDRVYPARNKSLAAEIAEHGCIISEFPLGTRSLAGNFPRRNRLIAALSQGTLVIEAATESGSLITARLAGEMGREVMAIPGSIDNPLSKGCHALIKQGAKLVENLDDILHECPFLLQKTQVHSYSHQSSQFIQSDTPVLLVEKTEDLLLDKTAASALTSPEKQILDGLGYGIVHPDTLVSTLGIPATDVYANLMALELGGWITALPGGCYQRIKS